MASLSCLVNGTSDITRRINSLRALVRTSRAAASSADVVLRQTVGELILVFQLLLQPV
jgi:hypothetical protein